MDEDLINVRDRYGTMLLSILLRRFRKHGFIIRGPCDIQIPYSLEKVSLNSNNVQRMVGKCSFVVLSGFNGVGKDAIGKELARLGFPRLPNVTTRKQRTNETKGVDYFFMAEEEFERARKAGKFLTFKRRHGTDWHGFLRQPFIDKLARGEKFHLDKSPVSWKDLLQFPEIKNTTYCAFYILPPSFNEWLRRLTDRTLTVGHEENIQSRLEDSLNNLQIVVDNPDVYDVFVVNDDIKRAVDIISNFFNS